MHNLIKYILTGIAVLFANIAMAQLDLGNEEVIYSFKTAKGKSVVICLNLDGDYLIYRFGTDEKVELEFPNEMNESSFKKFKYYYLFRGGGASNDGMDMNYLVFKNGNYKYIIYDEISENEKQCGIKVIDEKTGKTTDIKGVFNTRKGSLIDFRKNELLEVFEEMP